MDEPFADAQALGKLKEFLSQRRSPAARAGEECEFCAVQVADEHPHLVDLESRGLLCVCRPCYLLFMPGGAGGNRYRAVPEETWRAEDVTLSEAQWEELQIPINMAFFFHNQSLQRTVAFYPSPAGATESLLSLDRWQAVVDDNPRLGALEPDVEAFLVYRRDNGFDAYIVPIDACYELVGLIKKHWKGFHGGGEAWRQIEAFYERLNDRARSVSLRGGDA